LRTQLNIGFTRACGSSPIECSANLDNYQLPMGLILYKWRKGIAQWTVKDRLYLSIVFTWHLPEARDIATNSKKKVIVGGPAVKLLPDYLADVATIEQSTIFPALEFHNPMATFTSRGCDNNCDFCAVPQMEGPLRELTDWPVRPIICDNNLLGCSKGHFDRVIDRLKGLPFVDFNQGLEADLFTEHHASRMAELKRPMLRFAFDHVNEEGKVIDAIDRAHKAGLKDIGCYVLFNHRDTPDDTLYRLELLRSKGVLPNPMRYQPLDSLHKDCHLGKHWTDLDVKRIQRYYSKLNFLGHVPFADYNPQDVDKRKQIGLF
jgi:hypothetical protein